MGTHSNSYPQRNTLMGSNNLIVPGMPATFIALVTRPASNASLNLSAFRTASAGELHNVRIYD